MNKTAIAYTLGALTAAAVLVFAGNSAPAAAFFGGFIVPVVALALALSSRARIRAAADLLNRIAGGSPRTARVAKPAAPKVSPIESDVVDALVGLGSTKPTATAAAAKAVAANPAGDFALVFRSALQFSKA